MPFIGPAFHLSSCVARFRSINPDFDSPPDSALPLPKYDYRRSISDGGIDPPAL
jgi:hypothetical protein